jgi:hypothetical protein
MFFEYTFVNNHATLYLGILLHFMFTTQMCYLTYSICCTILHKFWCLNILSVLQHFLLLVVDVVVVPSLCHLWATNSTICCAVGRWTIYMLVVYSCFTILVDVLYGWNIHTLLSFRVTNSLINAVVFVSIDD